jgi:hypothetical protein
LHSVIGIREINGDGTVEFSELDAPLVDAGFIDRPKPGGNERDLRGMALRGSSQLDLVTVAME